MVKDTPQNNYKLSSDELERLDELLKSARKFHYLSFLLAGLSLLLSSLETFNGFSLPLGQIILPNTQTAVGFYIVVILLNMVADRFFLMVHPFLKYDPRRPPFAWIALSTRISSRRSITFWLMIPILICAISTANTIKGDLTGISLSITGIFIIFLPRTIDDYIDLIKKRKDERGGPATYSIFLLYHYRIIRQLWVSIFFFIPVLAVVQNGVRACYILEEL